MPKPGKPEAQQARKPRIPKIEHARRLRQVQEWIIQDLPSCDIIAHCVSKWEISDRQAKRYIADSLENWVDDNDKKLNAKRATRIASLKKLLRNMDPKFASTPHGINTQLRIYTLLVKLEGVTPTEQMIEAEMAVQKGKQADPLTPESSKLVIEALIPYGKNQTFNTTNPST